MAKCGGAPWLKSDQPRHPDTPDGHLVGYVASPYSAADSEGCPPSWNLKQWRAEAAAMFARICLDAGIAVFCPIAHAMPIVAAKPAIYPGDWRYWKRIDAPMVARSDFLLVLELPGFRESHGIESEEHLARLHGKPIIHCPGEPHEWPAFVSRLSAQLNRYGVEATEEIVEWTRQVKQ